MSGHIPEHLRSSVQLIRAAFGEVIPAEEYPALITILYEHFSDRNLAEVLSHCIQRDAIVILNDIAKFMSIENTTAEHVARVTKKLEAVGLQQWINESSK